MQKLKTFEGEEWPVSDAWYDHHIKTFDGIQKFTRDHIRATVLHLGNVAHLRVLTDQEVALIRACDAVTNFNSRIERLRRQETIHGQRDLVALFGREIGIDEITFTDWTSDICGCSTRILHHEKHEEKRNDMHFSHETLHACPVHKDLPGHYEPDHWAETLRENNHNQLSKAALVDELTQSTNDQLADLHAKMEDAEKRGDDDAFDDLEEKFNKLSKRRNRAHARIKTTHVGEDRILHLAHPALSAPRPYPHK